MDIRQISKEDLISFIASSKSKRAVLKKCGMLNNDSNQYYHLEQFIEENCVSIEHFTCKKRDMSKIASYVKDSRSIREVGLKLGLGVGERNLSTIWYKKIRRWIREHDIDISHFNFEARYVGNQTRYKDENLFILNSRASSHTVKDRYLKYRKANAIPYICDMDGCKVSTWLNKPMILQMDHKNGNNLDHGLENLRLLCPNCHSQTETFGGAGGTK